MIQTVVNAQTGLVENIEMTPEQIAEFTALQDHMAADTEQAKEKQIADAAAAKKLAEEAE